MSRLQVDTQVTLEEGKTTYDNIPARVAANFSQRGLVMPTRPVIRTQAGLAWYQGEMPAKPLTELTDEELGNLMGSIAGYLGYVQTNLAEAESNMLIARTKLDFIEAQIRLTHKTDMDGKKLTVQERSDVVQIDRRYVEANSEVAYCESVYKLTRAVFNASENNFSAVSRRITQRGQDLERERRNLGVSGGTNMPQGQPMFSGPRRP